MKFSFLTHIFGIENNKFSKFIYIFGLPFEVNSKVIFKWIYKYLPVEDKKIVISNYSGNTYGCNPKYITDEIIRRKLPYKLVWLVKNPKIEAESGNFPPEVKLVNYYSLKALKELATSKIWIATIRKICFFKAGLIKKRNQIYINTWHGSLGIKKLDADAPNFLNRVNWDGYEKKDSESLDYLLSNSQFENDLFKRNFDEHGEIKQFGHPRNDIFFSDSTVINEKIRNVLGLNKDVHICLYAPSYRDDGRIYCFGIKYEELLETLTEKFGGKWVVLVRLHPNFRQYQKRVIPQRENIYNVSEYPDIQELLVASDIAITDYSSCIFDFMLSRKPGFIYATDIKEFDEDRGFYYPLTSTPFPVAKNNDELRKNILEFDYKSYRKKVEEFLQEKGCMEDGHASERAVDLIEEIMNEGINEK